MFTAPTREQLFVLKHVTDIDELAGHNRFADATPDMVQAIVEGVGDFAEKEFAPLNRIGDTVGARMQDGHVVMPEGYKAAWRAYVANGWAGIAAPADYGGQGLPFSLATVSLESLGAANMALTLCPILSVGAVEALAHHGSEEQKRTYLPKLASGEWTGTMNLTEPQAGSDVGALTATATPREDGGWNIRGQKIYITFGDHDMAENIVHLVLARTPDAPAGTRGISLFLVPKFRVNEDGSIGEDNSVQTVSIEHKLGINASPTCVLAYGEDGDSIGHLIGPEHAGMRAMFTMMNSARLNVGLQGVQIGERATQQALAFAAERVQSARAGAETRDAVAIVDHPDVRRMLLRMKAGTQAIRALLYYASGQVDRATLGDEDARALADLLTPLSKAYATDMGIEIASLGIQVHGGMGFVEETGAAQHYRDARIAPIYEGTNGIQAADLVGRKLAMDGGAVARGLVDRITGDAGDTGPLADLAAATGRVLHWMQEDAGVDDKLGGSVPFLTMFATLVCGWLMARQRATARAEPNDGDDPFLKAKIAAADYYIAAMVPEATGLEASARAGAQLLYTLTADEMAA
ncbi:acyl-CoA dehydrogenase [Novosphingopyxis sp.]|uniref:acyl-CoA dehydrogenase n=1 Tax=Novosphingopyxis sp. TaxID=2709690 RepID=UPI003B5903AB